MRAARVGLHDRLIVAMSLVSVEVMGSDDGAFAENDRIARQLEQWGHIQPPVAVPAFLHRILSVIEDLGRALAFRNGIGESGEGASPLASGDSSRQRRVHQAGGERPRELRLEEFQGRCPSR